MGFEEKDILERLKQNEDGWIERKTEEIKPYIGLVLSKLQGMQLDKPFPIHPLSDVYGPMNTAVAAISEVIETPKSEVPLQSKDFELFINTLKFIKRRLEDLHALLSGKPSDADIHVLINDITFMSRSLSTPAEEVLVA